MDIPDTILEIKEEELEAAQSGADGVTAQKTVSIELGGRRASADDRISIGRKGSAEDRISIGRKGSVEASRKLSIEPPAKTGVRCQWNLFWLRCIRHNGLRDTMLFSLQLVSFCVCVYHSITVPCMC